VLSHTMLDLLELDLELEETVLAFRLDSDKDSFDVGLILYLDNERLD